MATANGERLRKNPILLRKLEELGIHELTDECLRDKAKSYKKRLQRTEREKGPSHTRTLSIIRSLKYVNMFLGKFDQAVSQFERLEASKEQSPKSYDRSDLEQNLHTGLLFLAFGQSLRARRYLEIAWEQHEKILSPTDTLVSELALLQGVMYHRLGILDAADIMFARALDLFSKGEKHGAHEQALHAFTERGVICYRRQCYEDARAILTQAVITAEKELGTSHWITMYAAESLATCYGFMGNLSETEAWHRRAIAWMEQAYGITHPILANSLMLLRTLMYEEGHLLESARLDAQLAGIQREPQNINPGEFVTRGQIYRDMRRFPEAAAVLEHVYPVVQAKNVLASVKVGSVLASVYLGQGQISKAQDLVVHLINVQTSLRAPQAGAMMNKIALHKVLVQILLVKQMFGKAKEELELVLAYQKESLLPGHRTIKETEILLDAIEGRRARMRIEVLSDHGERSESLQEQRTLNLDESIAKRAGQASGRGARNGLKGVDVADQPSGRAGLLPHETVSRVSITPWDFRSENPLTSPARGPASGNANSKSEDSPCVTDNKATPTSLPVVGDPEPAYSPGESTKSQSKESSLATDNKPTSSTTPLANDPQPANPPTEPIKPAKGKSRKVSFQLPNPETDEPSQAGPPTSKAVLPTNQPDPSSKPPTPQNQPSARNLPPHSETTIRIPDPIGKTRPGKRQTRLLSNFEEIGTSSMEATIPKEHESPSEATVPTEGAKGKEVSSQLDAALGKEADPSSKESETISGESVTREEEVALGLPGPSRSENRKAAVAADSPSPSEPTHSIGSAKAINQSTSETPQPGAAESLASAEAVPPPQAVLADSLPVKHSAEAVPHLSGRPSTPDTLCPICSQPTRTTTQQDYVRLDILRYMYNQCSSNIELKIILDAYLSGEATPAQVVRLWEFGREARRGLDGDRGG